MVSVAAAAATMFIYLYIYIFSLLADESSAQGGNILYSFGSSPAPTAAAAPATPTRGRGRGRGSRGGGARNSSGSGRNSSGGAAGGGASSGQQVRAPRMGRGASAVAKAIALSRPRCVGGLKHQPDPERLKDLFSPVSERIIESHTCDDYFNRKLSILFINLPSILIVICIGKIHQAFHTKMQLEEYQQVERMPIVNALVYFLCTILFCMIHTQGCRAVCVCVCVCVWERALCSFDLLQLFMFSLFYYYILFMF